MKLLSLKNILPVIIILGLIALITSNVIKCNNNKPLAPRDSIVYLPGETHIDTVWLPAKGEVKKKAETSYAAVDSASDWVKVSSTHFKDNVLDLYVKYYHAPVDSFLINYAVKNLEIIKTKTDTVKQFKIVPEMVEVPQVFYKDKFFWTSVAAIIIIILKIL